MLRTLVRTAKATARDRKGVTAAEYAILAVGVVIIVGAAVLAFKDPLKNAFTAIGEQINSQQSSIAR